MRARSDTCTQAVGEINVRKIHASHAKDGAEEERGRFPPVTEMDASAMRTTPRQS